MLQEKRVKVLHILRSTNSQSNLTREEGLERAVGELAKTQRALGLSVEVKQIDSETLSEAASMAVRQDWESLTECGQTIAAELDVDVLHAHDWYATPVAEHFFRNGFRNIISTIHLPIRRGFTYRDVDASWQAKALLESRLLDLSSKCVAISPYIAKLLADEYGVHHSNIAIVPHGVDLETFYLPNGQKRAHDFPQLLAVGRITEQKGFELLIRATKIVSSIFPNTTLSIIGSGARLEACKRLVRRLDLADFVSFRPHSSTSELLRAYQTADLLVMPSLFEPFGLVGLEAMACGCPVLATEPTGACYLEQSELTKDISPPRLARSIIRKLEDQTKNGTNRKALHERAKSWSWERSTNSMTKVYEERFRC